MVSPLPFQSSGDPALDRRLDWARAYLEDDAAVAAGMLADLAAEAPRFIAAWFLLGEAHETTGDLADAAAAYGEALRLDPDDTLGAGIRLARLGARDASGAMSPAFVRTLFDQYAPRFDTALRDGLAYRGPELLAEAVQRACTSSGRALHFRRLIDLGCGTGLAAPLFAPMAREMVGVDLSPAMVERAAVLGLYAELHAQEMAAFLERQAAASADTIIAVDALCYVGDLAPIFSAARRALRPDGLFAFTVETHDGAGMILRDTLRYAHGAALVEAGLGAAGFRVLDLSAAATRTEKNAPVPGLVCVADAAG
ncbi:methyltransferase domain-containing protein [Aquabacter sp. CN5-332]|uniref:class I SAM-dependent DNA methyltransferase n=1 Tax=Aquabacter sp. CN5-332 TaxID=3156608 RepID=UPI0032B5F87E